LPPSSWKNVLMFIILTLIVAVAAFNLPGQHLW
jgi:ABC-type lipoprotein release transport system permease subunit